MREFSACYVMIYNAVNSDMRCLLNRREKPLKDLAVWGILVYMSKNTLGSISILQRIDLLGCNGLRMGMLLVFLLSSFTVSTRASTNAPNVILIMSDDLGFEGLSANGSLRYSTPRIDDLAARGIRFEHCYVTPICTTSRVQLMSGIDTSRSYEAFTYMNPAYYTFGHMFQDAGYATCMAGKWQLNGDVYRMPGWNDLGRPQQAGFDETCSWYVAEGGTSRYGDPMLSINGAPAEVMAGEYGPDVANAFVLDFIDRHHDDRFFVYYPMILPHAPFERTPDSPVTSVTGDDFFTDMVHYMDKLVGQVVDKIDTLGIAENTIIIYMSDNGTDTRIVNQATTYGNVNGGKTMMTDAGTRVPMTAWWKGHSETGTVSDALINLTDFFPTFADAISFTDQGSLNLEGHSFYPLMVGDTNFVPRETTFVHYDARWFVGSQYRGRWARTQQYKLYEVGSGIRSGLLYDVQTDRLEQSPLPEPLTQAQDAAKQLLLAELALYPTLKFGFNSFYLPWKEIYFNATQLLDPGVVSRTADPDNDNKNNLYEYVLGTNPLVADDAGGVDVTMHDGSLIMSMAFNPIANGYKVRVEESPDLNTWTRLEESTTNVVLQVTGRGGESMVGMDVELPSDDEKHYYRLKIDEFTPSN